MGALGVPSPGLVGHAFRRPVVLTRNGPGAFALLVSKAHGRQWMRAPRPPVVDARSYPGG